MSASPRVTVVVPVYNCRDHLGATLESVFAQTMPQDQIEVIAVNDGSTDGSGEELDRLARRHGNLRVLHQENSGGPGGPRNRGIEAARGEHVFFLDADDRLGPEALQRMHTMAEENGTDIVVGRYVGVNRQVVNLRRTIPRVAVTDPSVNVYTRSLTAQKLFRGALLERHDLRFPEGLLSGEDKVFAAHAFLHAESVSVVADYDCYYLIGRDDVTSITQTGGADPADYYARVAPVLIDLVMSHTEPGPVRERMIIRHLRQDVLHRLNRRYLNGSEEWRRRTEDGIRAVLHDFPLSDAFAALPAFQRLCVHHLRHRPGTALSHGRRLALREIVRMRHDGHPVPAVVDKDRAFAVYPGFRAADAEIADSCFDVTGELRVTRRITRLEWADGLLLVEGEAHVEQIGDAPRTVELVLRCKRGRLEHRLPTEVPEGATGKGAFRALIDVATAADGGPLPPGLWDLHIALTFDEVVKEGRLGADRDESVSEPPAVLVAGAGTGGGAGAVTGAEAGAVDEACLVTPFFTSEYDNLTLDVGPSRRGLQRLVVLDEIGWDVRRRGRLVVGGRIPLGGSAERRARAAEDLRPAVEVVRRADGARVTGDVEVDLDETELGGVSTALRFRAVLDLRRCAAGQWDLQCRITAGTSVLEPLLLLRALPVPSAAPCDPLRSRHAYPSQTKGGTLAVHVTAPLRRAAASVRRKLTQNRGTSR